MQIKEITDSAAWNTFVLTQAPNTFLQSWQWGQIQMQTGEDVKYLGIFNGDTQVAAALVVVVNARRGKFLLIPHGPVFTQSERETFAELIPYCRKLASETKAVALRVAPLLETTLENKNLFSGFGFHPAPLHIHAELTWMLDIKKPEEDILSGMRKTTRHAIRKGEEAGVTVDIIPDPVGLDRFWPLYEATRDRHGFVPFSHNFLAAQAAAFLPENLGYFAIATYNRKDVAGAFMMKFGDTVFYHHGASLKLPSSIPAAQYLHWESIREAKRRGATAYNFWGIAPDNKPNHPFAGITTFKKGFGGYVVDYMHAQDLPVLMGYWKLWLVDTLRRRRRGF